MSKENTAGAAEVGASYTVTPLQAARRAQVARELSGAAKRVRRAEKHLQDMRDEQTKWLRSGSAAGFSLAQLAAASGVSRQAVQQRVKAV